MRSDFSSREETLNPSASSGWERVIFHVDMDAFFAAIEVRNNPALRGKPVLVGGPADARGVVSACSYEARPFGVHSGMPMGRALKLCPEAVVVSGSLKQYGYVSAELMKLLSEFTPLVEPFSVDEAFMDVSGSMKLFGGAKELAERVKQEIHHRLELTCSIGVAPNKIVAKMASKLEKPDGLTIISQAEFRKIYGPQPAGKLWGIGEKTALGLARLGIHTVQDLAGFPLAELEREFGKNAYWMHCLASGVNESSVRPLDDPADEKSISHETTFARDSLDRDYIHRALLALSERVARRLRRSDFLARTISVKVRSNTFQTITRDRSLRHPTADHRVIFETARNLIPAEYGVSVPVRLVGVRGANLSTSDPEIQTSLFEHPEETERKKSAKLAEAIDSVKDKFGDKALEPAALARRRDFHSE